VIKVDRKLEELDQLEPDPAEAALERTEAIPGSMVSMQRPPHDFDASYTSETPPAWDIGRAQPAFDRLAKAGDLVGSVLDAGCGTGEHALLAASLGHEVVGVDLSAKAIESAMRKAIERGIEARFLVADALRLTDLGRHFDTVLDCGLFHILDDVERERYVDGLAEVVPPGGRYHMLCFSDRAGWLRTKFGLPSPRDGRSSTSNPPSSTSPGNPPEPSPGRWRPNARRS
jgi:SAM-dependent methyltransferase